MTTLRRLAATALSAAIITAPVITASTADAAPAQAGRSWSTIAKWYGAKQQACYVPVHAGKSWRVYTRVVNGRQAEIGVGLDVVKNGDDVVRTWSSPLTKKGKTSKVGSVLLPLDDRFTLDAFQFQGQMGDGGPVKLRKIGRC